MLELPVRNDEFEDEDYAVYDGDYNTFLEELKTVARIYIDKFFADKSFYCGGKVPGYLLTAPANVNLVLSTPFEEGIDLCHKYLKYLAPPANAHRYPINWKVLSIIKMLKQVQKVGVPREMQAGLILLYLKISKGCPVKERPFDITHIVG